MISYWGIGAACGVVINDNLVLVDYINRVRKSGKHLLEAVIEAGVVRFRPIVITSITTFVGLMPIMLEPSVQANFFKASSYISNIWSCFMCACNFNLSTLFNGYWCRYKKVLIRIPQAIKKQFSPNAT